MFKFDLQDRTNTSSLLHWEHVAGGNLNETQLFRTRNLLNYYFSFSKSKIKNKIFSEKEASQFFGGNFDIFLALFEQSIGNLER